MNSRYCWIPILFLFFGFVLFGSGCGKQTVNPVTAPLPAPVEQKISEDPEGTRVSRQSPFFIFVVKLLQKNKAKLQ